MGATIVNRIEVSAVNLRNALEVAVSEKKSTIPVLTHVLLKPTESGIRVISTDLELAALTDITGKSENSESILIPFRKVLDLLKGESGPDERSGAVKWRLNGTCELSAQSSDTGKALATVDASITHTEETEVPVEVSIGLASPYVLEFLKIAGKNPVTMNVKDGSSAALLEVPAFHGYSYVLMPMRV